MSLVFILLCEGNMYRTKERRIACPRTIVQLIPSLEETIVQGMHKKDNQFYRLKSGRVIKRHCQTAFRH